MNYYSTNHHSSPVSFKGAVLAGLAPDGGLFMPENLPPMPQSCIEDMRSCSFPELSYTVAQHILGDAVPPKVLKEIVNDTLSFDCPIQQITDDTYALELFHGPTMAFKDVGARFMALVMAYFYRHDMPLTILVATSGDTGSAVAAGFYNIPNIRVVILYPKEKVSYIQEQQLTTWGHNIQAVEVDGVFDDCQALVKQALNDTKLRDKYHLSSANSINIARLIPQMFYYFYAYSRLPKSDETVVFSVPSGNFGNLTAGLFAKRMGLPIDRFIAATNANDVIPHYMKTGRFTPKPSIHTISNAMDVGNPSNSARIFDLYNYKKKALEKDIWAVSLSDDATKKAMQRVYKRYGYILDPHGAVAYAGLQQFRNQCALNQVPTPHNRQLTTNSGIGVFLETAHPAKFNDSVEKTLGVSIAIPDTLEKFMRKKKQSISIANDYHALEDVIIG